MLQRKASGPVVSARQVLGFLDRIDEAGFGGWVVDFSSPGTASMRILIDDVIADVINCDLHRDDAALLKLPTRRIGFYYNIPARYQDGLRHVVKLGTLDGAPIMMSSRSGEALAELHFCLAKPIRVEGALDGMINGLIQGWALNIDDNARTKLGGVRVLVTSGGQPVAELLADQYRADVAQAIGCEAVCGFTFAPPPELRSRNRSEFRFFAMPGRHELQGSPLEVIYPEDSERDRINALIARADELFAFAYHLRRELKVSLPAERYLLSDYARWAKKSLPLALPRTIARYGALPSPPLLVSVVCPVYRPVIGEFLTAVNSVRQQSYPHWELLLVDDGSEDTALSGAMQHLSEVDGRIKVLSLPSNGGIAEATNAGLRAASGSLSRFLTTMMCWSPRRWRLCCAPRRPQARNCCIRTRIRSTIRGRSRSRISSPITITGSSWTLTISHCHFADAKLIEQAGMLRQAV